MKTDVKETPQGYEMTMNLPGIKKEDVKAELKDGYLTVHASGNSENDEKDQAGKYICRERYNGSCSRSFYVGEEVKQEDIKAKFEDPLLIRGLKQKISGWLTDTAHGCCFWHFSASISALWPDVTAHRLHQGLPPI